MATAAPRLRPLMAVRRVWGIEVFGPIRELE